MEHLAEQRVLELVAGALAEPVALAAHAHLDACGECRAVVAGVLRSGDEAEVSETSDAPITEASTSAEGLDDPDRERATTAEAPAARRTPRALPREQLDEYRLVQLLGQGGMGSVYLAHDTLLGREVAIKLLPAASSDAARQRFLVEARAVARMRHPNVVVVHRVGEASGRAYIVYELVRGRTLAKLAAPLPWVKVLELAVGMTRGLAAAHACGVLHRDLKPANVMLDDRHDVVLVDFGLAKLDGADPITSTSIDSREDASPREPRMTATGIAMGTPRYMAPESWRAQPATAQTDLYSCGLVMYELLAGELPFPSGSAESLALRVCTEDPPPLLRAAPWVPPSLAAIVDRCIAREPANRPVSAAALAGDLEALQRGRAFDAIERARHPPAGNPYVGARSFGYEHHGMFFGRQGELRSLLDKLHEQPLVVVAGESGVGKTSLCAAGLLPVIARGGLGGARKWVPLMLVPGARPLVALAQAIAGHVELDPADLPRLLADDPEPVLAELRAGHRGGCTAHVLFVDQLDDLITLAPRDEALRFAALLGKLAEPAPALRVLATVRTAHLTSVAQLPGLAAAIGPALYLVLEPRDETSLRAIIAEPARLAGRQLGDDVVTSLVGAASSGELPIAQLAAKLAALWDQLAPTAVHPG